MLIDSSNPSKNFKPDDVQLIPAIDLPRDLIERIITNLTRKADLFSCFQVNKSFKATLETSPYLAKTLFKLRFPMMYALMEKESLTPENYKCTNYKEMIKYQIKEHQIDSTIISIYSSEIFGRHVEKIKLLSKSDDQRLVTTVCSQAIQLWDRHGKHLGSRNLTGITDITIVHGLIYAICHNYELFVYSTSENDSSGQLKELYRQNNPERTLFREISDIGLISVLDKGNVFLLRNLNQYNLISPFNSTETFKVKGLSRNHIILINPKLAENYVAEISVLKIVMKKSEDGTSEQFSLEEVKLENPYLTRNIQEGLFEVSENNRLYYYSVWETDCWDLCTGKKIKSLPESTIPPILTQGKVVICYKNTLKIVDEKTHAIILQEELSFKDILTLQEEIHQYKSNSRLCKSIDYIDGLILSKKFAIWTSYPHFQEDENYSLDDDWKLFNNRDKCNELIDRIDFPDGKKIIIYNDEVERKTIRFRGFA